MDVLKDLGVDAKKVRDGVWINLATREPLEETAIGEQISAVLVARAGNRKFNQSYADKLMKNRSRRTIEDDRDLRLRAEVIADTVILDWRNLKANGQPWPYSKANVITVVVDETYADFFDLLMTLAQDVSYYRLASQETVVKNS
jgi:hypothetical protein